MTAQLTSCKDAAEMLRDPQSAVLIDVRTPAEFASVHAQGAHNVPLDRLTAHGVREAFPQAQAGTVLLICKSGMRSDQACQKLAGQGMDNVISVDGGTMAWDAAGLPVIRGRAALPLDRQVQTVAGTIATTGMVLGTWVNPWFYLLAAMVGCGLLMSGLTGFCPMGILMARMPWNQRTQPGASCCAPGANS